MRKTHFSVKHPKSASRFMVFTGLVILIIPVIFTLFQGKLPTAAYCIFFLLSLPFLIAALWMGIFRIDVQEDYLSVRRGIGVRYGFHAAEIRRVVYKITLTGVGKSQAIQIFVNQHRIAVGNMMDGAKELDEFIRQTISADRIEVKERSLNNG